MNYFQCNCPICKSENALLFEEIYNTLKTGDISALFTTKRIRFKGEGDKIKFTNLILARTTPPNIPTLSPFDLFISICGGFIGTITGINWSEILSVFFGNYFQELIFVFTLIGGYLAFRSRYKHSIQLKKIEWGIQFLKWQESCLSEMQ